MTSVNFLTNFGDHYLQPQDMMWIITSELHSVFYKQPLQGLEVCETFLMKPQTFKTQVAKPQT